jgi:uncharacterized membrane protein
MVLLAAVGISLALSEEHVPLVAAWSARFPWSIPRDAVGAQYILGAIAASIMTVLSVVYSVLLLVLTFASMQFSPRIIVAFMKDRVSQVTLGAFLGTFAVCLLILPSIHAGPPPFVPTLAVTFALVLAMASLVCLLYFVHNMALSIQPNSIVERIARETEAVIDTLFDSKPSNRPVATAPPDAGTVLHAVSSGYIQYIDVKALVAAAHAHDICLRVSRPIGQFVPKGAPLATLFPASRASTPCKRAALRAFHLAAVRTMEDDVEFGVLQIVDIALKAVSPAINDPSTAIACIDFLTHILAMAATKRPPTTEVLDNSGALRVVLKQTSFERLLDMAFDQVAHYAQTDMAVCLRVLRALREVAEVADDAHLAPILVRAEWVYGLCAKHFTPHETAELTERLAQIAHKTSRVATT